MENYYKGWRCNAGFVMTEIYSCRGESSRIKVLKMPKLYEYLGIVIFFYSNEHEPVHVHGRYGETESKIEIIVEGGVVQGIKLQRVPGKKPLSAIQSRHFKKLVKVLGDEIVQSWINYFVYHKKIVPKKIAGRL